ncbi:formate dehydrogenase subunit delta [Paraburkholderia sp. RL18-103-BIB-C]|uniref:formate dehydrogenase subunit delta n=1 Tax=unclassified Paraburkholderia TaxID=2615204 RepID=UPI0038B8944C
MPERNRAMGDVADHIQKFWESRMRRQILESLDEHGAEVSAKPSGRSLVQHRALPELRLPRR